MRIDRIEATIVSVPYRHRETSSQVARDGVVVGGGGRVGHRAVQPRRGAQRAGSSRSSAALAVWPMRARKSVPMSAA